MADALREQLRRIEQERDQTRNHVRQLEEEIRRQRERTLEEVSRLRNTGDLSGKLVELMAAMKAQEDMFHRQLNAAREENDRMSEQVRKILLQMHEESEAHKRSLEEMDARTKQIMDELHARRKAERAMIKEALLGLLDDTIDMLDKRTRWTLHGKTGFVDPKAELIRGEINAAETMLSQSKEREMEMISTIIRKRPEAGSFLQTLAYQYSSAAGRQNVLNGRAEDWTHVPNHAIVTNNNFLIN